MDFVFVCCRDDETLLLLSPLISMLLFFQSCAQLIYDSLACCMSNLTPRSSVFIYIPRILFGLSDYTVTLKKGWQCWLCRWCWWWCSVISNGIKGTGEKCTRLTSLWSLAGTECFFKEESYSSSFMLQPCPNCPLNTTGLQSLRQSHHAPSFPSATAQGA